MADLLNNEVMDILMDKYFFTNIPPKFNDFDSRTLINIYLRMITVVDDAYEISHLKCPFDITQELTSESKQYFLKHIIRCIRALECSYLAPKTLDLLDKKRALRILTSLHEEGVKKYGKGLLQRIRAVIKREEMKNKNLIKKVSKVNGAQVTTNGREVNGENIAEFFKDNSESEQPSSSSIPLKTSVTTMIIPEGIFTKESLKTLRKTLPFNQMKFNTSVRLQKPQGRSKTYVQRRTTRQPFRKLVRQPFREADPPRKFKPECRQIPRTPLKLDHIDTNIKDQELMPPPPEFGGPSTHAELAVSCLSPPTEFSDVDGSCLQALHIFSPPEEFKDTSEGNSNTDMCSPRSRPSISPNSVYTNSPSTPNGKEVCNYNPSTQKTSTSNNLSMKMMLEDFHIPKEKCNQVTVIEDGIFALQRKEGYQKVHIDGSFSKAPVIVDRKFRCEDNDEKSDSIQNSAESFFDNKYSPINILKNVHSYETEAYQRLNDVAPLRFMNDDVACLQRDILNVRETNDIAPKPLNSRETFVVSHPLKSRETFVVSKPLKREENSIYDEEAENGKNLESDQPVESQVNENQCDKGDLSQSLDSNSNRSLMYQEVEENSIVTVKEENGRKTLIRKTKISPDVVTTTVTEINYAKNKAVRHFPKGKELLRTPPSSDSSLCSKSYNLDSSFNLNKNDLLVQIYMSKKDANHLQNKKSFSADSKCLENVSELKSFVNSSINSYCEIKDACSSTELNSLTVDTGRCKMDIENVNSGSGISFECNWQNLDSDTSASQITNELCLKNKKSDVINTQISGSPLNLATNIITYSNSAVDEVLQTSNISTLDDDSLSIFPSKRKRTVEVESKICGTSIVSGTNCSVLNHQNDIPSNKPLEKKNFIKEPSKLVKEIAKIEEAFVEDSPTTKQIEQVDVSKRTRKAKKVDTNDKENDITGEFSEAKNRRLITRKKRAAPLEKVIELNEKNSLDVDPLKSTRVLTNATDSDCNVRKCRAKTKEKEVKKDVDNKANVASDKNELIDIIPDIECADKNSVENAICNLSKVWKSSIKLANHNGNHEANRNKYEVVTDRELIADEVESIKSTPFENENKRNINDKNARKTTSKYLQLKCDSDGFTKNVSDVKKVNMSRRGKTKSFKAESLVPPPVNKCKKNSKSESNKNKATSIAEDSERKSEQDELEADANNEHIIKGEEVLNENNLFKKLKTQKGTKSSKASDGLSDNIPVLNKIKGKKHNGAKSSKTDVEKDKNGSIICTSSDIPKEHIVKNKKIRGQCHTVANSLVVGEKEKVVAMVHCEMKVVSKDKKTKVKKVTSKNVLMESKCDEDHVVCEIKVVRRNSIKSTKTENLTDIKNQIEKDKIGNNKGLCTPTEISKEINLKLKGNKEEVLGVAHCDSKVILKDKKTKVINMEKFLNKAAPIKSKCNKENVGCGSDVKKQSKMKSSKTKFANLKKETTVDNMENIKIKPSLKLKNEKKGQNADENAYEKSTLVPEKLVHARSPLQVINARPSRRCKTKASEAIFQALNDSLC